MEAINVTTIQAPEVDTVRIYWCCASVLDFSLFTHFGSTKYVMSLQRSLDGKITNEWEKFRSDMRCSWWGKMQVTQECYSGEPCLSFEFSVAKWWGITNGINFQSGIDFRRIFEPISEVFAILRINAYYYGNGHAFEHFLKNCVLRRIDLSLNFKVKSPFSVADYIKLLACTRLNGKFGKKYVDPSKVQGDWESLTFGTANSAYFVKFYDKFLEQKNYFSKRDVDNNPEYTALKKIFWRKNKDQLKNILRFEVEFRSKFFREKQMANQGVKAMAEIIDVCAMQWRALLDQFKDALCRRNLEIRERPLDVILADLDRLYSVGSISQQSYHSQLAFLLRCYRIGVDEVKKSMSRQTFYSHRQKILEVLNFDVLELCPIMRIMQPTELVTEYNQQFVMEFSPAQFVPLEYVDLIAV